MHNNFNFLIMKVGNVLHTKASHNTASNSADLGLVLMTKSSWKFLHNAEPWISADKNNLHGSEILD